jgi:hypothetical protein
MSRSSIAIVAVAAVLAFATPAADAQSPAPTASGSPKAIQRAPAFSSKVDIPSGAVSSVSSSACNRRAVGVNNLQGTLGPNGATESQTLIAVPIGGEGNVSSTTTQQQLSEVCAHRR